MMLMHKVSFLKTVKSPPRSGFHKKCPRYSVYLNAAVSSAVIVTNLTMATLALKCQSSVIIITLHHIN